MHHGTKYLIYIMINTVKLHVLVLHESLIESRILYRNMS